MEFTCSKFKAEGFMSSPFAKGNNTKSLQFLCNAHVCLFLILDVNKRFVSNTAIHDLLNAEMKRSFKTSKNQPSQYPMFIINITCPPSFYDISFQPDKQHVEFEVMHFISEINL